MELPGEVGQVNETLSGLGAVRGGLFKKRPFPRTRPRARRRWPQQCPDVYRGGLSAKPLLTLSQEGFSVT